MISEELQEKTKKIEKNHQKDDLEHYRVIIFNDEITTQDFVVMLLEQVFRLDLRHAINLMMEIHLSGQGIAGVYPFDIALYKREQAIKLARSAHYPLKIECEKVE
ncbi:ATP-dependent Clp protease adaptor ClpS [Entomospira entomophila]|uniref:ATP-dependent Clp protease adapter protein ClpS n=1 Tax=Entomospira entomophila TaxID=2719988 RepID=A0A968GCZ0_9SPIO|nr:ATP-dependent Clp protease adaptor ClpS [Entomospira entomophilus]NIZ41171.1 ATP-dependent Clp protease adaptor ClpS [Entomospira entomophilus]WDI35378.1 ATP-dependent Clp protease adaptor ClpS [Entomospira entomophilus]